MKNNLILGVSLIIIAWISVFGFMLWKLQSVAYSIFSTKSIIEIVLFSSLGIGFSVWSFVASKKRENKSSRELKRGTAELKLGSFRLSRNSLLTGVLVFIIVNVFVYAASDGNLYHMKIAFVVSVLLGIWSGFGVSSSEKSLERKEILENAFENQKDFKSNNHYFSELSEMLIGFDDKRKKVCFFDKAQKAFIYDYNKILQCEVVVDGETYLKQSTSGTVGRALVGGALTGGIGAIIGGMTASQKQTNMVSSLDLKIIIDDLSNPLFKINFYTGMTDKKSVMYKNVYAEIEKWHAIISGLMRQGGKSTL